MWKFHSETEWKMELLNHDFKCETEWKIELFNYDLNVEQSENGISYFL